MAVQAICTGSDKEALRLTGLTHVRPSPISGAWYSSDPELLSSQVDGYLHAAHFAPVDGRVIGLVAPHAGLRYSGATAGHAFATVIGQQRPLVAILSPLHDYHSAAFLTTAYEAYRTPLGEVPVAWDALERISADLSSDGGLVPLRADREHSLEIELPFLQRAMTGPFALLPIMVRTLDPAMIARLAESLARHLADRDPLLVASTDLSHFYPLEQAARLDGELLRLVEGFSPAEVLAAQQAGTGYACGIAALAAVMQAAKLLGANRSRVLHYSTSGDVTGDTRSVVGYAAAVIYTEAAG